MISEIESLTKQLISKTEFLRSSVIRDKKRIFARSRRPSKNTCVLYKQVNDLNVKIMSITGPA